MPGSIWVVLAVLATTGTPHILVEHGLESEYPLQLKHMQSKTSDRSLYLSGSSYIQITIFQLRPCYQSNTSTRSYEEELQLLAHNIAQKRAYLRSRIGAGRLRSYFEPGIRQHFLAQRVILNVIVPPGEVGGRYGSGCFHFSNKFSVSCIRICGEKVSEALAVDYFYLHTRCCRGSVTCLFASKRDRMYRA